MSKTSFVFFYLLIVSFLLACAYAEKKTENSTQPERESIIPYHAFGLFVIWSVLVELPLFAIKKLKSPTIHLALFAILDLSTLCSVGFVVVESNND